MILGWKRNRELRSKRAMTSRVTLEQVHLGISNVDPIILENVNLPPAIENLSANIAPSSWILLYGKDDFAKALFCDLCFSYIKPEQGKILHARKGAEVGFLGRSSNTYGQSLIDQLTSGVSHPQKEQLQFVVDHVLSDRFRRLLDQENSLLFKDGKKSRELELDERDFLEIAEANLLLQKKKSVVIDTTADFYQTALEQGYRHSKLFLNAKKTLFWILNEEQKQSVDYKPWLDSPDTNTNKLSLFFPNESPSAYIN